MEKKEPEESVISKLDLEIEEEILALKKKNEFILHLINEIGKTLDKNFRQIKDFDYESNIEDLIYLFSYFDSFCDEKKEKSIAIRTISLIILQIDNLNNTWEEIINKVKLIIIQDNYLENKATRMNLMLSIMKDLKLLLTEEKRYYLDYFSKKFGMNIMTLFELMTHFITCDDNGNKDLLYFTFKTILENYQNLIISEEIFKLADDKGAISLNDLNQLLLLDFNDEQNIIVFEQSKFQIRAPNNDELLAYIKGDPSKKITDYFYNNSMDKINAEKDEDNVNNMPKPVEKSVENLGNIQLNSVEKYLVDKLEEYDEKFQNQNKKIIQLEFQMNNLQQENIQLRFRMSHMEMDLKKIKLRSLYKGIIDIFANIYHIEINDYYKNKLEGILKRLNQIKSNEKVEELEEFLLIIYSFLQKGNSMAHTLIENIPPLEKIFTLIKKEKKKSFPIVKKLLNDLSFNNALKEVENSYYSLKDRNQLLGKIKISSDELMKKLLMK